MKTIIPVALSLLWSACAFAQPATLSSETGLLEIPNLVIDGRVALSGVDLMITNEGAHEFQVVDFDFKPLRDNLPREKELAFGESFILETDKQLSFIGVLSESRCPSDVVCIHAGEVTVILRLTESLSSGNTLRTDFGLTLLGTDISWFEHQGVYFRLLDVTPHPDSSDELSEDDYSITVEYQAVPFKN